MTDDGRIRPPRILAPESIAGWILADILIVLFIVGLGAAVQPKRPEPTPTPTPTPSATPTPTPTPKPPPRPIVGMKVKPAVVTVSYSPTALTRGGTSRRAELTRVCRQLRTFASDRKLTNDRAALVLIFAGGPRDQVDQAVTEAEHIGKGLTASCVRGALFDRTVITRAFWNGQISRGRARLELYLYTTKR